MQFLLPPTQTEEVVMEAIPQSLQDAGIVSLEIGCSSCLLTGKNVSDGRS